MSFFEKFKTKFRQFMIGRNGADELSFTLLIAGLIIAIVASLTGSAIINLLSTALYVLCVLRILSRNIAKRYEENRKFVEWKQNQKTSISQAKIRLQNIRKYKYFKCPECQALLKLPRKVGEVTVTCGKCRHAFKKKA